MSTEQDDASMAKAVLDVMAEQVGKNAKVGYVNVAGYAALDKRDTVWKSTVDRQRPGTQRFKVGKVTDSTATDNVPLVSAALTQHSDVAGVFAPYDELAKGAVLAVQNKKLQGKVKVFGADVSNADIQQHDRRRTAPGSRPRAPTRPPSARPSCAPPPWNWPATRQDLRGVPGRRHYTGLPAREEDRRTWTSCGGAARAEPLAGLHRGLDRECRPLSRPGPSTPRNSPGRPPAVALADVSMAFGGRTVLASVSLDIAPGSVVALLGANGAGKSTLIKILSGVHAGHGGQVRVDGAPVVLDSPLAARRLGIQTVHQRIGEGIVPGLTVAENLVFEELARRRGNPFVSGRATLARAREIQAGLGLDWSDAVLKQDVTELGISDRQLLILARALATRPRLLVLDEPTSALSATEAQRLFALVARMREDGIAVLYVSHRLGEIDALADRLVVLRDGLLTEDQARPFDWDAALRAMLGPGAGGHHRPARPGGRLGRDPALPARSAALRRPRTARPRPARGRGHRRRRPAGRGQDRARPWPVRRRALP